MTTPQVRDQVARHLYTARPLLEGPQPVAWEDLILAAAKPPARRTPWERYLTCRLGDMRRRATEALRGAG